MINILIATHGPLADALVETSQFIIGSEVAIETVSLYIGDSPDDFKQKVSSKIDTLSNENGLVILTDLYGGTPANTVMSKLFELNFPDTILCYVGVNLPILLETIALCTHSTVESMRTQLNELLPLSMMNLTDQFKNRVKI